MEILKQRILKEGKCLAGGVLKVDSFLNHQIDPQLMMEIAEEFVKRFQSKQIDKIITVEASGIAPALMVGYLLHKPVVFIKKKVPKTMENMLTTSIHSFTKDRDYYVCVSADFLEKGDKVLFIDDFLANGNAANGAYSLIRQAGAELQGMGFVIEKDFQNGGRSLREKGFDVQSLAIIKEITPEGVTFL